MFKQLYNQARIAFTVEPVTPILIKTGRETFDPTRPDMEFVRTKTLYGEVPYLPGSSLRGVIRSHAERILRTLGLIDCDITDSRNSCVKNGERIDPPKRYKEHCYACRTFGSTCLAGRMRISDAYPWPVAAHGEAVQNVVLAVKEHVPTEIRTNVRIDRRKGTAAGGALFEAEVVSAGRFSGEFTLVNYQLWQVALLALVFRDINYGFQRLGAAKARGLGRVSLSIDDFAFQQYGALAGDSEELRGIGCLDPVVLEQYDLVDGDRIPLPGTLAKSKEESLPGMVALYQGREDQEPHQAWLALSKSLVGGDPWRQLIGRSTYGKSGTGRE